MTEGGNDTFRILLATDNHLGYKEADPIIGNDSFEAFEFILQTAKKEKVDFVLLGGDLFDANKPSRNTMNKTIELLNRYCLGSNDINFVYHPTDEPCIAFLPINYEDEHLSIDLPIFAIHGNHDDPIYENGSSAPLSALDVLSKTRLLNYFACVDKVDDICVRPILLEKGTTKLAIYGMGFIPDERLSRMFVDKKVNFKVPPNENDWFNIFLIHQNCEPRPTIRSMNLNLLPSFLDLVIWGHEHNCKIEPTWNKEGNFYTMQPGSSCITSLSDTEVAPKHIAILSIKGKELNVSSIPIPNMRKFIYRSISLSNFTYLSPETPNVEAKMEKIFDDEMNDILDNAKNETKLPLVRLSVDSTGFPSISPQLYGAKYIGKVANPNNLLLLKKKRNYQHNDADGFDDASDILTGAAQFDMMADLIGKNIEKAGGLSFLSQHHMQDTLKQYVEKGCGSSWNMMLQKMNTIMNESLDSLDFSKENPDSIVNFIRDKIERSDTSYLENLIRDIKLNDDDDDDSDDDSDTPNPKRKTAQRKRGTSTTRGRGRK